MATVNEPKELGPRTLLVFKLLLPVLILVMLGGLVGILVLLDNDKAFAISRSQAATVYRKLIVWNGSIPALLVNAPLMGIVYLGIALRGHRIAKKQEPSERVKDAPSNQHNKKHQ